MVEPLAWLAIGIRNEPLPGGSPNVRTSETHAPQESIWRRRKLVKKALDNEDLEETERGCGRRRKNRDRAFATSVACQLQVGEIFPVCAGGAISVRGRILGCLCRLLSMEPSRSSVLPLRLCWKARMGRQYGKGEWEAHATLSSEEIKGGIKKKRMQNAFADRSCGNRESCVSRDVTRFPTSLGLGLAPTGGEVSTAAAAPVEQRQFLFLLSRFLSLSLSLPEFAQLSLFSVFAQLALQFVFSLARSMFVAQPWRLLGLSFDQVSI